MLVQLAYHQKLFIIAFRNPSLMKQLSHGLHVYVR